MSNSAAQQNQSLSLSLSPSLSLSLTSMSKFKVHHNLRMSNSAAQQNLSLSLHSTRHKINEFPRECHRMALLTAISHKNIPSANVLYCISLCGISLLLSASLSLAHFDHPQHSLVHIVQSVCNTVHDLQQQKITRVSINFSFCQVKGPHKEILSLSLSHTCQCSVMLLCCLYNMFMFA